MTLFLFGLAIGAVGSGSMVCAVMLDIKRLNRQSTF